MNGKKSTAMFSLKVEQDIQRSFTKIITLIKAKCMFSGVKMNQIKSWMIFGDLIWIQTSGITSNTLKIKAISLCPGQDIHVNSFKVTWWYLGEYKKLRRSLTIVLFTISQLIDGLKSEVCIKLTRTLPLIHTHRHYIKRNKIRVAILQRILFHQLRKWT